ncbi:MULTISPECIES: hypothetical protein [Roseobacteraceae]|uniref:hypothetical protein n=1 Tax=Roseobacteraceae TaxID=2854170 RepID=UPI0031E35BD9
MNNPTSIQILRDHVRAFIWSGRPVIIHYVDRDTYCKNSQRRDGYEIDGICSPGIWISRVQIFTPLLDGRLETLRHECSHVRFHFIKRSPEACAEARQLFREHEPTAAYYESQDGFDTTGEAMVRLADRRRTGRDMPRLSPELTRCVEEMAEPAPASAFAFVVVLASVLLAFASALPSLG